MIVRIREWYAGRSLRERRLVLLMLAIAAPLIAWLVVVAPLSRAYESALERHLEAVDRNGRIRALAESPRTPTASVQPATGDLSLVAADSASQAGLSLESNNAAGPNAVAVSVTQARPTAVSQWLSSLEGRGIRVEDLRMTPSGPGSVAVSARLVRTAP